MKKKTHFFTSLCFAASLLAGVPAPVMAEESAVTEAASVSWSLEMKSSASNEVECSLTWSDPQPDSPLVLTLDDAGNFRIDRTEIRDGDSVLASMAVSGKNLTVTLMEAGVTWMQAGNGLTIPFYINYTAGTQSVGLTSNSSYYTTIDVSRFSGVPISGDCQSSHEFDVQPLSGTTSQKIAQLKEMFPQDTYWNHPASQNGDYWPDSVTDHPCASHSDVHSGDYQCNWFDYGAQCNGFARLCFFKFHGHRISNSNAVEKVDGAAGLRVGDVIFTTTALDSPDGHYSFVTDIVGDTVYKLEANYSGNCRIWQSGTVQLSDVKSHYTLRYSGLSFDGNGGRGSMSAQRFINGDAVSLELNRFYKAGCQFAGWNVRDTATGHYIYTNGTGYMDYESDEAAASAGYPEKAVIGDGASLSFDVYNGRQVELVACWEKADPQPVTMYRLYNPNSGEHFYTSREAERDHLVSVGWKYEGIGWTALSVSDVPVFRLYNPNAGDHHYTTSEGERDSLISAGWLYEGLGWYSDQSEDIPLYRQYNPNAGTGSHNYTTSKSENDNLVRAGWKAEGIGWYGVK